MLTPVKNTRKKNDMRMLISNWIVCSQIRRSNEGFLRIVLRVFHIVRLEFVLLVDLLPLRTLLLSQRSHRVDAGALKELIHAVRRRGARYGATWLVSQKV